MKIVNKVIYEREDFNDLINNLKENEENFNIHFSSSKLLLENDTFRYVFYPNKIKTKRGLNFIKEVSEYVEKNKITYDFDKQIVYNQKSSIIKQSINYKKELFEVDLKAAYWHFFYQNKFINTELYKKGLKVDKTIRLMALGKFAKSVNIFVYKKGQLIRNEIIRNKLTEGLFFKVAYDTDLIMRALMKELPREDYFFYWVDAIFFRGIKNMEKIKQLLEDNYLNYKIVPLRRLIKRKNKFEVEDFDFKIREFNFMNKNSKKNLDLINGDNKKGLKTNTNFLNNK